MKILGIDTTTKFLSLGLYDGSKSYGYSLDMGTKHSSLLIPTIKRALEALGWQAEEIDYFACGLGPGSFTGMRVGLATIKGLSWSLKKPVVGISTLDLLAFGAEEDGRLIVPALDARRSLIYCSAYIKKGSALRRVKPYLLVSEKEFLRIAKPHSIILGDAIGVYKEKFLSNIRGVSILDKDYWYPKPHAIIKLALDKITSGKTTDTFKVKPIYLYPKECQIKL